MAVIEFQNVDIVFGKNTAHALELIDQGATREEIIARSGVILGAAGVNLQVKHGEICVLMGLSGSGKSTMLRAINGLNPVSRGAMLVEHDGAVIDVARCGEARLRELRMRTVAMVFQQFALLPWRTVRDNVGFGLELRGMRAEERRRIVDEKLAMVGLSQWAEKYTNELSGGMQQRVGLARAFATDADILLMDEPFSALDPLIRAKLQDELLELQRKLRKTIVFVSHDLDEAMKLGSTISILEGGRIVQTGTAEDILIRPASAYVAEFVKHMNPLNVLRGNAIMTPFSALRRDGEAVLIDAAGRLRIKIDKSKRPIAATLDGREARMAACNCEAEATTVDSADFVVAPADLPLRTAIALKRRTDHPILLVDELGSLAGLCGDTEIYNGLLQSRGVRAS